MRSYTDLPQVKLMRCVQQLTELAAEIEALVETDAKRHPMDQDLLPGVEDNCYELIGAIKEFTHQIEAIDGYDPTPQHLWDGSGSEPLLSAAERLAAEWQQHLAVHS